MGNIWRQDPAINSNKFAVSNAQKVQKFAVVPGDFSEKGGELTATLKLKRKNGREVQGRHRCHVRVKRTACIPRISWTRHRTRHDRVRGR